MRIVFLSPAASEKRPGALVSHWLWVILALVILLPLLIFSFAIFVVIAIAIAVMLFVVLPLRRKFRQWKAGMSTDGRKNVRVVVSDPYHRGTV